MKKKTVKKILLAAAVIGTLSGGYIYNTTNVLAASDVESSNVTAMEENGQSQERSLKENSWRYQDGEPINNEEKNRAVINQNAWDKVDDQYVNDKGDVIPGAKKKGIDVSEHNGDIDWNKVKADGIEFAIIRCGYGSDLIEQDDKQWLHNVSECERLGIPYGVYLYSYADTPDKAKSEAKHVLRLLKCHNPAYSVYYDLEDDKMTKPLSSSMKGQIAKIFCDMVSSAGYKVGIYANLDWWSNYLTDSVFDNPNWSRWVAQYNSSCSYKGSYDVWQCTSQGKVKGIIGNGGNVDINFWIGNVPGAAILQYDSNSGNWYVYTDGKVDRGYTGMAENKYGWWYVTNGEVDWSYTGMAQNPYGWWYVSNGMVDWSYVGMAQNPYGWWYISNGTVDWSYVGMAENKYGWWYMSNGTVDWNYTGMAQNSYGWWYMSNGTVDWSYVGMAQNPYTWWYISNGTVDWNYVGMAENKHGWWYISNGTIDWNYKGDVYFNKKKYVVINGYAGK